jgi:hypothetical protein
MLISCSFISNDDIPPHLVRQLVSVISHPEESPLTLGKSYQHRPKDVDNDQEDHLCDLEFSLAFGGKILLHNTNLPERCGKNGAAKQL